jgi:hypothetical protein
MRSVVITGVIVCLLLGAGQQNAQAEITLEWSELPELPTPTGMPGVAGPYVGISNDALIVAGGVSFPEPQLESNKVWHDDIYVLVRDSGVGDSYRWITGQQLERPVEASYVSVATMPSERIPTYSCCAGIRRKNRSFKSRCRVCPNLAPLQVPQSLVTRST